MSSTRYRTARQEHIGAALDDLSGRGLLRWHWDYDEKRKRALFHVKEEGWDWDIRHTQATERLVQSLYDDLDVPWKPVPPPGGLLEREETVAWMEQQKSMRDGDA